MALGDIFTTSDEAAMLGDTVRRFVENQPQVSSIDRRANGGFDPQIWQQFVDMGLPGLIVHPEFGGLGLGPAETRVLAHQLGYGLVSEPVLTSGILCSEILQHCAPSGPAAAVLERAGAGDIRLALAGYEQGDTVLMGRAGQTTLTQGKTGWQLSGEKTLVIGAPNASHLIVTATQVDGQLALILVATDLAGVVVSHLWTVDDRPAARVTFRDVDITDQQVLATGPTAEQALRRGIQAYAAAECAEAVGVMERCGQLCRDYLATREQFGAPLATFQSLQHEVADMYVDTELSRTMAIFAAHNAAQDAGFSAVVQAKAQIGLASRKIGEAAIQLHGGMGMTDALPIGRCFKRLLFLEAHLGTPDALLAQVR